MQPLAGLFGSLVLASAAAWAWAFAAFHDRPVLMGTALLAWSLGLRHAVDADHIAAIDNVTRKLMQAGRRPLSVGLFFALGHSAVVAHWRPLCNPRTNERLSRHRAAAMIDTPGDNRARTQTRKDTQCRAHPGSVCCRLARWQRC